MSSMVQDAYDMGLTTSLGGMPKSSLYYDDDEDTYNEEFEDESEEYLEETEFPETNILKLNINKKRAVLHNDEKCVGNTGNVMNFNTYDDYQQFLYDNLADYKIFECPLCVENSYNNTQQGGTREPEYQVPVIDFDDEEIPF
jgi:hypothetical protein